MDTSERTLRAILALIVVALLSTVAIAEDAKGVLHVKGTGWLNGTVVPNSSAIFPGDMVQTQPGSMADITLSGSSVMIAPDSIVKFDQTVMSLENGGVSVATTTGLGVRVCDITVVPTSNQTTEFRVANEDGKVTVVAQTGDVNVTSNQHHTTVSQQNTHEERCEGIAKRSRKPGAIGAGTSGLLSSPVVMWTGVAVVGGVTTWILIQGSGPLSPKDP